MYWWLTIIDFIMAYLIVKTKDNKYVNEIILMLGCIVVLFNLMAL